MQILMTANNIGGGFTYALELATALGPLGVDVAIATRGPKFTPVQLQQLRALRHVQVFENHFKLEWQNDPWSDLSAAGDWLLGLELKVRPDVIHLNDYAHGQLPFLAPAVVVAHNCVASWYAHVKKQPLPPDFARYAEQVKRGVTCADEVVAVTQTMANELRRHYGIDKPIRVIPNARGSRGNQRGLKDKLIFAAGKLGDPARNLSALAAIAKSIPWQIAVGGDEGSGAVEEAATGIHRLGALTPTEMGQVMGKAAIFALPARYETSNIHCLEAALSGCALVLGDTPWMRELWEGCAEFVDPEDPEDLRVSLNLLIEDEARRKQLALAAHSRALLHRSPEKQALAYRQLYKEMVKARVVFEAEAV